MFIITNFDIVMKIIEKFEQGIEVKVIVDDLALNHKQSLMNLFLEKRIPCESDSSKKFHMHHKFVLIDKDIVLTGSLNWTKKAVNHNNENVVIIQNNVV
jgi:cardiolipin hydrolase